MLKKIIDRLMAFIIILLTLPPMLIMAILIKLTSLGPIFFKQTRLGKKTKPFEIYKFRTMTNRSDVKSDQLTLANDKRITKIGAILRKLKLDELPQFVNVLKGDMSIVGPRPDVPKYYDLTNPQHKKVLSVKPGLTSPAAIKYSLTNEYDEAKLLAKADDPDALYRNQIFPDKIKLNAEYVDNQSVWSDLKIIFKTIIKIIHKS